MTEEREYFAPEPGEVQELAKALLAVADDPSQVMTHKSGNEFSVPVSVAERYRKSLRPSGRRSKKEES